jgi:hypothetical protein
MLPHDLVMGVIGGFLLWFGWYGFNPGSSLSAMDFGGIGRISTNTTLAACTAGLAAEFFVYFRTKKWDCAILYQRLPGRPGGHHLPLLLGQPDRRVHIWAPSRAWWSILASICSNTPHRRSDRRLAGPRPVRRVGHACRWVVRLRTILRRRQLAEWHPRDRSGRQSGPHRPVLRRRLESASRRSASAHSASTARCSPAPCWSWAS